MVTAVTMEIVVVVAIGILATIFVASLLGLLLLCRHKYCKPRDLISQEHLQQNDPDANLVDNMEGQTELPSGVLELDHVTPDLESILQNDAWVNDATGLVPHCLAILKTAHELTERLVGMTMRNSQQLTSPETITDLVSISKRIGPRVDDVVTALYPPLDPRLLEARCSALVLSVSHLVLVTKNACHMSGVLDWIDQSLADVEDHLQFLREASRAYEETSPHQSQAISSAHYTNQSAGQSSISANDVSPPQPDIVHDNVHKTEMTTSSSQV